MPRQQAQPIITLTTDFGMRDHYVACMKGVIAQIAPDARVIDVSHAIEPQNILGAAYVLYNAIGWFPPQSIHVVVVDPGVGTSRGIIAARYGTQTVIAPDNGIISLVHQAYKIDEARIINNPHIALSQVSNTFHGRDIMAPAAAHLAKGAGFNELGPATNHVEVLQSVKPKIKSAAKIEGQVIYIDHFGNLLSNIRGRDLEAMSDDGGEFLVSICGSESGLRSIGKLQKTYANVPAGDLVSIVSSGGFVEIAVHLGNAQERLGSEIGHPVVVERNRDSR
ncbi:MAG: SAM-dependent chlorinase/fluorinase [Phycisphaerales bacterium]|nr:SAM-dependent chlorinase/fluorinase [Phycisphaerales bacterium]